MNTIATFPAILNQNSQLPDGRKLVDLPDGVLSIILSKLEDFRTLRCTCKKFEAIVCVDMRTALLNTSDNLDLNNLLKKLTNLVSLKLHPQSDTDGKSASFSGLTLDNSKIAHFSLKSLKANLDQMLAYSDSENLFSSFPNLEHVDLSSSDYPFQGNFFDTLFLVLPRLKNLNLAMCKGINSQNLAALFKAAKTLNALDLTGIFHQGGLTHQIGLEKMEHLTQLTLGKDALNDEDLITILSRTTIFSLSSS